jgi:hypothetical protein
VWRFDQDDESTIGPEGADKQDRVLIDDFDPIFFFALRLCGVALITIGTYQVKQSTQTAKRAVVLGLADFDGLI